MVTDYPTLCMFVLCIILGIIMLALCMFIVTALAGATGSRRVEQSTKLSIEVHWEQE